MTNLPQFRARTLARIAFADKRDKAGRTLFSHALRVAERCPEPRAYTIALLHDIVEDTAVTLSDLGVFFDSTTVEAVSALTRRTTETYARYIERIRTDGPAVAGTVKIPDLRDHLATAHSIPASLERRYRKALARLTDPRPHD